MVTVLIALILMLLSAVALLIGYILTGKSKLRKGCNPNCATEESCCKKWK